MTAAVQPRASYRPRSKRLPARCFSGRQICDASRPNPVFELTPVR